MRMGGQVGMVYTIIKGENGHVSPEDVKFYEEMLYPDSEAEQDPCSERSIIYNVSMISGIATRALKAYLRKAPIAREIIIDTANMDIYKRD